MDEINAIVNEFNRVEAEQAARLESLFELFEARRGYRSVHIGGMHWDNCFNQFPKRLWMDKFIAPAARIIKVVSYGSD